MHTCMRTSLSFPVGINGAYSVDQPNKDLLMIQILDLAIFTSSACAIQAGLMRMIIILFSTLSVMDHSSSLLTFWNTLLILR
jgi:hypothetical protein